MIELDEFSFLSSPLEPLCYCGLFIFTVLSVGICPTTAAGDVNNAFSESEQLLTITNLLLKQIHEAVSTCASVTHDHVTRGSLD